MLRTIIRIQEDDTGTELPKFILRVTFSTACLVLANLAAIIYAINTMEPVQGLDGKPWVVLDGAYRIYWAPYFATLAVMAFLGVVFQIPLSSSRYSVILIGLYFFHIFTNGDQIQLATDYVVREHAKTSKYDYSPCIKLHDRGGLGGTLDVVGPRDDRELKYVSPTNFVYARTRQLCDGLKQQLGRSDTVENNRYSGYAWGKTYEYRKSFEPGLKYLNPVY